MHLSRREVSASILMSALGLGAEVVTAQDAPPPDSTPPLPVPHLPGIIVLFDGTPETLQKNWVQNDKEPVWKLENLTMTAVKSDIQTRDFYKDFQLHLEFRVPFMPDKKGQARGNSGVHLQGRYEIQILDSYGFQEPGTGDCGAVYNQAAPLVNACKPPQLWQVYEIGFRAPRFDVGSKKMTEPARVTVWLNGIMVQNNQVISGPTHVSKPIKTAEGAILTPPPGGRIEIAPGGTPVVIQDDYSTPGPIRLQYHGSPVAFRNIWILPERSEPARHYEPR